MPQNFLISPECPKFSAAAYIINFVNSLVSEEEQTHSVENIVQHYSYSSFGKILKIENGGVDNTINPAIKNRFTYTNREYDSELGGLYYYRARWYDSHSGRFMSEDPHPGYMEIPSTINSKYIYTGNSPLNFADATGADFISDIFGGKAGGYTLDAFFAVTAIAILATVSGGTSLAWMAALKSVAATAAGAAIAAYASEVVSGGNFDENFHSFFRVSVTFLALSAAYTGGSASHNWIQGTIESSSVEGGMTIGSAQVYGGGSGVMGHELGHTIQFITIAAFNKRAESTWGIYFATGAISNLIGRASLAFGNRYDAWYNPFERSATILGGGSL